MALLASTLPSRYSHQLIDRPPTSRPCSDDTRAVLRRARDTVDVVPIGDRTAFALLQVEMGRDLEEVRAKLGLD